MKAILLLFFPLTLVAQTPLPQRIDSLIKANPYFSGAVLVAEKGKIAYLNSNGYRNWTMPFPIPLQDNDIFELASVSKQFTAMIIMMLKEKGKLSYDDPVEKYLTIPYKKITIRHLLNHTGGLPDYEEIIDKHWDKSKVAGNPENIEYLNQYAPPAVFEPGTKYEYSNTGYILLASIAEKASGEDFIELSRKWIFKPLKMKNTDLRTLEQKAATNNFALGHIYVEDRKWYVRADSFPSSDYTIWLGNRKGSGRVSSTAEDLLKWDQALYTEKLVKQSTLKEAFTPGKLNDGSPTQYGFGWATRIDTTLGLIVSHTGDNPGYHTIIIRYVDQKKTMIILSNNAYDLNLLVPQIRKLMFSYAPGASVSGD